MIDLTLKNFYEQDKALAAAGIDYEGIWRVLGHAKAVHFILPYYTDNFYYKLDNEELFEQYHDLEIDMTCNLTDRNFKLNIYDVAGVYEHKRNTGSYTGKLEKYFSTISFFANTYVPGELTPIPQLKENGAFITGFTEIISSTCLGFDMLELKDCVLSYGNNQNDWDKCRKLEINDFINELEIEAAKIVYQIDSLSLEEIAYLCGKYSFFLHYDNQSYMRSNIIEAFFVCKSRLPEKDRIDCFADRYLYEKLYNSKQHINDLVLMESFEKGLYYTLKFLFYTDSSTQRVCEVLARDAEHSIALLSARIYH